MTRDPAAGEACGEPVTAPSSSAMLDTLTTASAVSQSPSAGSGSPGCRARPLWPARYPKPSS